MEIKFYHIHIFRCGRHVYIAVYKQPFILKDIFICLAYYTHTWYMGTAPQVKCDQWMDYDLSDHIALHLFFHSSVPLSWNWLYLPPPSNLKAFLFCFFSIDKHAFVLTGACEQPLTQSLCIQQSPVSPFASATLICRRRFFALPPIHGRTMTDNRASLGAQQKAAGFHFRVRI